MLAYLKGKVINKGEQLIVLVQDLGYKVAVPENILTQAKVDSAIELYTHEHIREDARDLYGFTSWSDLQFFELLISVSGVGPKTALTVLGKYKVDQVKQSILHNDPSVLTKISGIGKKTAERLILELKSKIDVLPLGSYAGEAEIEDEAIDALVSLGYTKGEALKVLSKLDPELSLEEKVRHALKQIGQNKLR